MVVEFGCSNRWSLTTGSVEEEACSSSDRCSRPINARAAEEFPGSVTVGQLAEARTETGSSETITRLVGRPSAAACCRFRCSGIDSKAPPQSVGERKTLKNWRRKYGSTHFPRSGNKNFAPIGAKFLVFGTLFLRKMILKGAEIV
jgi:hypothetical protein